LLIRHLPRERYEPVVACPPGEQLRELIPAPVPVLDLPLTATFVTANRFSGNAMTYARGLASSLSAVVALRRLIESHHVDLIHANNFKMHVLATLASRGRKIPVLWHVRDIFPRRNTRLLRMAGRAAARVLTVSRAVAAQFGDESKVSIVYNAVEMPPPPAGRGPEQPPVVGYVGRLDAGKGLDTLVKAFLGLHVRYPRARLLIAGEGPERRSIPSHPAIDVLGFQSDLSGAWGQMDICVQPSSQPDSFPRAVIEAMSWAKPVIGAAIGGIPEAIEEEATGLLFEPGDVAGLSVRLEALLRDRDRAKAMGAAGRRRCEKLFSVPAQIQQLTRIYDNTYALCHS
jgi:glycosyltransferase involved in cell wall biosynthesis